MRDGIFMPISDLGDAADKLCHFAARICQDQNSRNCGNDIELSVAQDMLTVVRASLASNAEMASQELLLASVFSPLHHAAGSTGFP
jgi:hypothetical protein